MERWLLLLRMLLPTLWLGDGGAQVYSVGEIREIGPGDLPDDLIRNALYVIPQPIQYCGTLTNFEASGFYFPNNKTDQLQLELRIYQRECDGTYASALEDTITFVPDNISAPYGLVMGENLDTLVIDGDLVSISVFTHVQCSNNNRCPIQPVILPNSTTTTMPAVWYNSDRDINNLITRSDVFLNVRVSIEPIGTSVCQPLPSVIPTATPIIGEYTFRVRAYRQVCEDGIYRQLYSRRFDHIQDHNDTYGTIVLTNKLGFHVMRNDLIGILVDSECLSNGLCPFQPAIQSNSISQVLYHSGGSVNELQLVTGIFLNIEASIDPIDPTQCHSAGYSESSATLLPTTLSGSNTTPTPIVIIRHTGLRAGPVIGIVASVLIFLFVFGVFIFGIIILCNKKKIGLLMSHKQIQTKTECFTEDDTTRSSHL